MITKSTAYALARDGAIVALGSKKDMDKLRRAGGGTIWVNFTGSLKIGDTPR